MKNRGKIGKDGFRNRVEESESGSESENESDGERQDEIQVSVERYKWDRSSVSFFFPSQSSFEITRKNLVSYTLLFCSNSNQLLKHSNWKNFQQSKMMCCNNY